MDRRFEGKVALITGAGSGIGRAVALQLAAEGAQVFGVDIDAAALEDAAGEAAGAMMTRPTSPPGRPRLLPGCGEGLRGRVTLDVLGSIAGIAASNHVTDVTVERYRKMMAVNADAAFFLAQAAVPHLLATSGNIVILASNAGLMGQAYAPSCTACRGCRRAADSGTGHGVRQDRPPGQRHRPGRGGGHTLARNPSVSRRHRRGPDAALHGFRGMAHVQEVADLFAFVASDQARSIHGAVLSIDNGLTTG